LPRQPSCRRRIAVAQMNGDTGVDQNQQVPKAPYAWGTGSPDASQPVSV
jgi:hypothetical protein